MTAHAPWKPDRHTLFTAWFLAIALLNLLVSVPVRAGEPQDPESTLRELVRANADRDLATLSKYMAHDPDAIGYTLDGRKYLGWDALADEMRSEFESVTKLEIPITDLRMWVRGDVAWFAMELEYIRYVTERGSTQRIAMPLRETGVLERRDGRWILVSWHESARHHQDGIVGTRTGSGPLLHRTSDNPSTTGESYDLSGEWEVTEIEENKSYRATLDRQGNGPYTWQGGHFTTTSFKDRRWQGTWKQTGNDREGGFEIVLSEDGTQAKGIWWYLRVGSRNNIPPRQHGGSVAWKRLTAPPSSIP
ncbi:MAG TPA: nuclear transport factor 2 family protein [Nitrospiraceae bacterium]|nr:nuclear transport factor 2 family protein [Nitrospiraceae bacterium]